MNMEECKWENGHPVINGPCFMNRTTLKGRDRVNEKLAENEAECKKNPKKKSIGINAIVDINGSTLVLGENDSFKTALEKIKDSGFEVVRVKNCFNGEAYDNTGYGDIKVNVRTKNGFVGEIIIADKYTTEQKMNGAGHGLYEVTRSLSRAIELAKPEVIEDAKAVRKIADEMSRLVYLKPGEDHSKFGERFEKVKSMCDKMQKIVDENPQYFEKKIIDGMPKLLNKIKDPTTYDGYREELKRRGL